MGVHELQRNTIPWHQQRDDERSTLCDNFIRLRNSPLFSPPRTSFSTGWRSLPLCYRSTTHSGLVVDGLVVADRSNGLLGHPTWRRVITSCGVIFDRRSTTRWARYSTILMNWPTRFNRKFEIFQLRCSVEACETSKSESSCVFKPMAVTLSSFQCIIEYVNRLSLFLYDTCSYDVFKHLYWYLTNKRCTWIF